MLWQRRTCICWQRTLGTTGSAVHAGWAWTMLKSMPYITITTATAWKKWSTRCWSAGKWRRDLLAAPSGSSAKLWMDSLKSTSFRRSWTCAALPTWPKPPSLFRLLLTQMYRGLLSHMWLLARIKFESRLSSICVITWPLNQTWMVRVSKYAQRNILTEFIDEYKMIFLFKEVKIYVERNIHCECIAGACCGHTVRFHYVRELVCIVKQVLLIWELISVLGTNLVVFYLMSCFTLSRVLTSL